LRLSQRFVELRSADSRGGCPYVKTKNAIRVFPDGVLITSVSILRLL
jgi:hypothetical protein